MDYFDKILRNMMTMQNSLFGNIDDEIEAISKAVFTGDLQGDWKVQEINQPNMKGYVIYGQLKSDQPLNSMTPSVLDPRRPKRPLPRKPQINDLREPLTDVFEDEKNVKLYVELPGVTKDDIQLNISEGKAEVKAKDFYTTAQLPTSDIETKKIKATCNNGILEVIIPKKTTTKTEKKHKISIE
jgi:HSP20 family molecular chaperone IbpA